ncbi:hypothetical protein HGA89_02030 [bacterium]|nr:hypothetical protein [bacterium]
MRVTLLTPYLPHEAIGHGGGVAVRGMARALARRHEVTLVALERPGEAGLAAPTAASLGCRVVTVPFLRGDVHDLDGLDEIARHLLVG